MKSSEKNYHPLHDSPLQSDQISSERDTTTLNPNENYGNHGHHHNQLREDPYHQFSGNATVHHDDDDDDDLNVKNPACPYQEWPEEVQRGGPALGGLQVVSSSSSSPARRSRKEALLCASVVPAVEGCCTDDDALDDDLRTGDYYPLPAGPVWPLARPSRSPPPPSSSSPAPPGRPWSPSSVVVPLVVEMPAGLQGKLPVPVWNEFCQVAAHRRALLLGEASGGCRASSCWSGGTPSTHSEMGGGFTSFLASVGGLLFPLFVLLVVTFFFQQQHVTSSFTDNAQGGNDPNNRPEQPTMNLVTSLLQLLLLGCIFMIWYARIWSRLHRGLHFAMKLLTVEWSSRLETYGLQVRYVCYPPLPYHDEWEGHPSSLSSSSSQHHHHHHGCCRPPQVGRWPFSEESYLEFYPMEADSGPPRAQSVQRPEREMQALEPVSVV